MAQVDMCTMPVVDVCSWYHRQGVVSGMPFLTVCTLEPSACPGVVGVLIVLE